LLKPATAIRIAFALGNAMTTSTALAQDFFFAAHGLQGLQAFFAAHGLQGLQAFFAAHGLQGLQAFFAAQGLQGLQP
jgi:hypothetical protein